MNRPPQKLEPLTIPQLNTITEQLQDVVNVCVSAIETMKVHQHEELFVLYRKTLLSVVRDLKKIREPIRDSANAMQLGQPLTTESVSPRSVRRVDVLMDDARKMLKESREAHEKKKKGAG